MTGHDCRRSKRHRLGPCAGRRCRQCHAAIFSFAGPDVRNKRRHGVRSGDQADRAAERRCARFWRAPPAGRHPGRRIRRCAGTSGLTWVLDPIDGTRGFMSGTPTWGVLIALSDDSGPRWASSTSPISASGLGRCGSRRRAGPRGERPLATRATRPLADAILFTTFPESARPQDRARFQRVAGRCGWCATAWIATPMRCWPRARSTW
jgi:fructose-1,6-bisphosphatase/inositol monophosphatase family enzyme